MNKDKEKISAYLDDALSQAELDDLANHVEEPGVASRYQMMGEALRGQMSDAAMIDVHLQVREALDDESLVNVPDINQAGNKGSIFDLTAWVNRVRLNSTRLNSTWYRPLGGLAVAASVAMIMVITVTQEEMASDASLLAENATTNTTRIVSLPVATSSAISPTTPVINETGTHTTPEQQLADQRLLEQLQSPINLDTYLVEHAEFAAQDTMQGRIPYVRAVSYEAE